MKKAKRDSRVYLEDIVSAIERIMDYTKRGRKIFLEDTLIQDGVIRQLCIVGEAAAKLPLSLKAKHEEIPWRNIIGMRNIIIHDYSETDIPTVWNTVKNDLPLLHQVIDRILKDTTRQR